MPATVPCVMKQTALQARLMILPTHGCRLFRRGPVLKSKGDGSPAFVYSINRSRPKRLVPHLARISFARWIPAKTRGRAAHRLNAEVTIRT